MTIHLVETSILRSAKLYLETALSFYKEKLIYVLYNVN